MSSFSERLGFKKPKLKLQFDEIDAALKAGLWDALDSTAFINIDSYNNEYSDSFDTLTIRIWHGFLKKPTDTRSEYPDLCIPMMQSEKFERFFLMRSFLKPTIFWNLWLKI